MARPTSAAVRGLSRRNLISSHRAWGGYLFVLSLFTVLGCSLSSSPTAKTLTDNSSNSVEAIDKAIERDTVATESGTDAATVPAESWADQVGKVASGESQTIEITSLPIQGEQLHDLGSIASRLQVLILDHGQVTDQDAEKLANLNALVHLRLRESPLTDAGLQRLLGTGHPELRILNLPQAALTSQGLRQLCLLPNLIQLRIGGRQLDDEAAAIISELPNLRSLHLIGPSLTSSGLKHLAKCPQLYSLYIDDCPLPDEAWLALFNDKPELHVHIDQHHHDRDPNADPH
ncbi:MAG: hypothetical protein KDB03_22495 [Planctomycetales bacterium]|nr:hypothetical protein [Planctomycetales bacterium]